jgi:hypothetical protein|tara:strand:- start:225 stop:455 length:231 start_codon:yes stop_codon:yes gene_type:complete
MTSVNITTNKNTVTIDENNSSVITVATQGPQGASAADSVNIDNAVNRSIVYYDSTSSRLVADATWTTNTITDGGNF